MTDVELVVEQLAQEIFDMWVSGYDREGKEGAQELYRERIRAMLKKHPHIAAGWSRA